MNKKTIIVVIAVSASLLGLMAWGYSKMAGPTFADLSERGALTASQTFYDFGTISMARGKVNHMFQITNPTGQDIAIKNLQTSCMCTSAYIVDGDSRTGPFGMPGMGGMTMADSVVKAGGSVGIDVVFDPAAHGPAGVGDIDRFIYATESDRGTLQFEVKAVVTP
jgi:hypothetical protein